MHLTRMRHCRAPCWAAFQTEISVAWAGFGRHEAMRDYLVGLAVMIFVVLFATYLFAPDVITFGLSACSLRLSPCGYSSDFRCLSLPHRRQGTGL